MLTAWSANRNIYYTHHSQTLFIPTPSTMHIYTYTCYHLKKMPQNKLQKKHFAKKCKNKSCRDALPPKNTSPKTNETSDSAHHNACTDYPHITAQCIYRVATIPTSFQPHPPQSVPRPFNCTPKLPQHTTIHNYHHQP